MEYFKYGNALSLQAYWKMIFAFGGAFFAFLATPAIFADGISVGEILQAIQVSMAAAGLTYVSPANETTTSE